VSRLPPVDSRAGPLVAERGWSWQPSRSRTSSSPDRSGGPKAPNAAASRGSSSLLRASDPRIAGQLLDLSPWRPVSGLPPVRRDLSLVVDAPIEAETLGDRVRSALGNRSDDLESVTLLQVTSYEQLPPQARDKLGLGVDQVNALVRIVLRPLDRTLTDDDANRLRDDIYRALHQGPVLELIHGQRRC